MFPTTISQRPVASPVLSFSDAVIAARRLATSVVSARGEGRRHLADLQSNNNVVEVGTDTGGMQDLSDKELERLLAKKRLACEEERIVELTSSETNTVMASVDGVSAMGATLEMEVSFEHSRP